MVAAPVGILAVQGGFEAHLRALERIGVAGTLIRSAEDLAPVRGLILPGGESSTQLELLDRLDMFEALHEIWRRNLPILATCAGVILAARRVSPTQRSLGWLDVHVRRNAYGRQRESFTARDDSGAMPLVFIRSPRITHIADQVRVLATYRGEPVLVRQDNLTAATFHPELCNYPAMHRACFVTVPNAGSCPLEPPHLLGQSHAHDHAQRCYDAAHDDRQD